MSQSAYLRARAPLDERLSLKLLLLLPLLLSSPPSHFSGFSTWPSKVAGVGNYSVEHIEWRGGKGDMVAEFLAAAEQLDVAPGVFYSVHNNWAHDVYSWKTKDPSA